MILKLVRHLWGVDHKHGLEPHRPHWREAGCEVTQQRCGMAVSTLTPEFGPPLYLHTLPYTQAPVADWADICDWQARRQQARFAKKFVSQS